MRISEIFRSIQGESTYAGLPCTFVRTAGCSLRCAYCDTDYALNLLSGDEMNMDAVEEQVLRLGCDLVEITGGEPLEQEETPALCQRFLDRNATVLVETSGAYPIDCLPVQTIKIMDIKTPSSRMAARTDWANLERLADRDEIKFVLSDRNDFDWAVAVCRERNLWNRRAILFAPAFSVLPPIQLAEWIIQEKLAVRLQLQLHKYIWPPDARGV